MASLSGSRAYKRLAVCQAILRPRSTKGHSGNMARIYFGYGRAIAYALWFSCLPDIHDAGFNLQIFQIAAQFFQSMARKIAQPDTFLYPETVLLHALHHLCSFLVITNIISNDIHCSSLLVVSSFSMAARLGRGKG